MSWDHVRIERSATHEGCADLFCMKGSERCPGIAIAHLPIAGEPSRASVTASKNWVLMLDCMAEINGRAGRGDSVSVETSNGDKWEHTI